VTRIRILPDILANKIAAGEVVERPASVVKELLENSLDAGADSILVEVEKGGRELIRVSDNGCGMDRDDALLSIERFATSKISTDKDLFEVNTLGFRGEALPSMASVSKMTIISRSAQDMAGTLIELDGGRIVRVQETGAPVGTQICIERLFFNTPARRKFLKGQATEWGHIADRVISLALGFGSVGFTLVHNNRTVFDWPKVSDSADRVMAVLAPPDSEKLIPIFHEGGFVEVFGWLAPPSLARSSSKGSYLFVNNRLVADRTVAHALVQGYSNRLMKGRFPCAVLFIKVPQSEVDVNVHPAKAQVRFARQQAVHDTIANAVAKALEVLDRTPWATGHKVEGSIQAVGESLPPGETMGIPAEQEESGAFTRPIISASPARAILRETTQSHAFTRVWSAPPVAEKGRETAGLLWEEDGQTPLILVGQIYNSYIICQKKGALIIIDQHAAHERILFEQYSRARAQNAVEVQTLLFPLTITLGHSEALVLEGMIEELNRAGMEVERFSGTTFAIKAVPAFLPEKNILALIRQMVDAASQAPREAAVEEALMLMACHGAVRANQPLTNREMEALLADLGRCRQPSQCPHGRPVWFEMTEDEIRRRFKRQ
jgi:DNA mismatch repair protein MutL